MKFGAFVTSVIPERIVTHVQAGEDLAFESERRRVSARLERADDRIASV